MLAELAKAVRERRVSSSELVERCLERIQRLNPSLNAVVAVREQALEDAGRMDRRVSAGDDPGPLAGLPLLVKDNSHVAGMRTTSGSLTRSEAAAAERDSLAVERLRGAGAIVVGKTNVPEFAFLGHTDNLLFGPTRNPWGPEWSPGGSSGGSAAALAAGMAPIATATDGGGSIRIPAAFCGLVGLKPTNGIVGRRPMTSWLDVSTDGPLAPSVGDARLLLGVMAGPAPGDPTAVATWLPEGGGIRRIVASPRTWPSGPLPDGMRASFDSALERIESGLKLPVERIDPAELFHVEGNPGEDWFVTVAAEELGYLGREFVTANLERFSAPFRSAMEFALGLTLDAYLGARIRRFEYARQMDELLGEDAVHVCPTVGYEGWLADGTLPGTSAPADSDGYNTGEANLTGHPSVSVPAGTSANGIPFGLQFTGPRWRDDLLLDLAERWEQANPWPRSATGYEPFDS